MTFASPTNDISHGTRSAEVFEAGGISRAWHPAVSLSRWETYFSPHWKTSLSVAVATILCCAAFNFFFDSSKPEWIPLPQDHYVGSGAPPPIASNQDSREDPRFRHAFDNPKQPIFARIAAINPLLVALPVAGSDESSEITVAKEPGSDFRDTDLSEDTLLAVSPDAKPSLSFAGVWAPTSKACSPKSNDRQLLPAVINEDGAWAGEVSCRFRGIKQSGDVAVVTSTCSDGRQRWTAKVRLAVTGDRLIWSSERGSQTYVRCAPRIVEALARI
jgi:hypothetical protein